MRATPKLERPPLSIEASLGSIQQRDVNCEESIAD
jgi:hypothetical protein